MKNYASPYEVVDRFSVYGDLDGMTVGEFISHLSKHSNDAKIMANTDVAKHEEFDYITILEKTS